MLLGHTNPVRAAAQLRKKMVAEQMWKGRCSNAQSALKRCTTCVPWRERFWFLSFESVEGEKETHTKKAS